MHPVESYLKALSEVDRTGGGTAEESYYGALQNLLDEIGAKLKLKVRAVSQLANPAGVRPISACSPPISFSAQRTKNPSKAHRPSAATSPPVTHAGPTPSACRS